MMVMMAVVMVMMMVAMIMMVMAMRLVLAFDPDLAFAASANSAHQFTSSSLIRNSSPPVTCNWCDPHFGHGS